MDFVSDLTTDELQTIFLGGQLLLLVVAASLAWLEFRNAREQRKDQTRPFVVIDLVESARPKFFDLMVKNIGATMARDVTFKFDPAMETSPDYVDLGTLKAFTEGISAFPPGREFRTLLDFGPKRHETGLPDTYEVTVSYTGPSEDDDYEETFTLDFGLFWNRMSITTRTIHDVYAELEGIHQQIRQWRTPIGGGLRIVDQAEIDRRNKEAKRSLANAWWKPSPSRLAMLREQFLGLLRRARR